MPPSLPTGSPTGSPISPPASAPTGSPTGPLQPPAIELIAVAKRYGAYTAVADLDLSVARGEVLGFLGPNGAGKTTTIRLLLGFLRPSAGRVRLLGCDMADPPAAHAARAGLGFVPDVAGLDPSAEGIWLLDELSSLQRRPPLDRADLLTALDLRPEDLHRPMGRLSRGTRQKINLVQGLQHRPDLIILDEPTEGLDPLAKRALFDLLQAARARGATIFFSSHVLAEVEELCDRVALIRRGRLIAVDRIADLRAHLQRRVSVQFATAAGDDPSVPAHTLAQSPAVANLTYAGGRWHFTTADSPAALRLLAPLPVADITIAPPSLEDVFLQYYRANEEHRPNEGHRPEEGHRPNEGQEHRPAEEDHPEEEDRPEDGREASSRG